MCTAFFLQSWGFYAHKLIHEYAIYTLPTDIALFFKFHRAELIERAVDADKRVYVHDDEGPRHFIDIEDLIDKDLESIPMRWVDAKEKYGEEKLKETGVVPWQIYRSYIQLIEAFKSKDESKIIRTAADLGHYISDAHVPLHTTKNYNGQLSGQIGIHAFWESRLTEMYGSEYNLLVGKVEWIEKPLQRAWDIVKSSHILVDSVLNIEKSLSESYPKKEQKSYIKRNNQVIFNYSDIYAKAYHEALNGMVEQRMRNSVHQVASYWYSAWIEAGQPDLSSLLKKRKKSKPDSKKETQSLDMHKERKH